ncbi:MAG: SEC-C metal-binding domain-containing protein, partial [Nitrospinaceae bacterium]
EHNDMVLELNRSIPDLFDILKKRYKEVKTIGEEIMKTKPRKMFGAQKIGPNDSCPCGSGKKYKKCCAQKLN